MSQDFEDFKIFNIEVGDMDLQKCSKMCNFKRKKSFFCVLPISNEIDKYKLAMFNTVRYKASAI